MTRIALILILAALAALATAGCGKDCPDGDNSGSLYCHGGTGVDGQIEEPPPGGCVDPEFGCSGVCVNRGTDRNNCGSCGNVCGDGSVCNSGVCDNACSDTATLCGSSCVDTNIDNNHCGDCNIACNGGTSCVAGDCLCGGGSVLCGGNCVNPMNDNGFCGAAGDCAGGNAGSSCSVDEACVGGVCTSTVTYVGSLTITNGLWNYGGAIGLPGGNFKCNEQWPGSAVCERNKLLSAPASELANAVDFLNNPVSSWWVHDPLATDIRRCENNNNVGVPWTYGTADQGKGGYYVDLTDRPNGILGSVVDAPAPICNTSRHVPCCNLVVAP